MDNTAYGKSSLALMQTNTRSVKNRRNPFAIGPAVVLGSGASEARMNRILAISVLGLLFVCTTCAQAEPPAADAEKVTIPLDQIWAYQMPGTRNIRDLEPDKYGPDTRALPSEERWKLLWESFTEQIHQSLRLELVAPGSRELKKPKPAFAVAGEGREALERACDVLAKGREPEATMPADRDISVVFFSLPGNSFVQFRDVEIHGHDIQIRFSFVTQRNRGVESHFALIPLGTLPPGGYKIAISEVAPDVPGPGQEKGELHADWRDQFVCKDSTFTIAD